MLASAFFIVIVAIASIIYGLIAHRLFTLRYVFNANFIVAAVVILSGIVVMFIPSALVVKGSRLLDRSTFVERSFNTREIRQHRARGILWVGIFNTLLTGLIQLLLSLII